MEASKIRDGIYKCLENTGTLVKEKNDNFKLKEVITDSLAFVTFEIEVENYFHIDIPAEKFSSNWVDFSINQLISLIQSCF